MDIVPKVIFEDQYLLIINKPAGIVVNRTKSAKQPTIQDWIAKNRPQTIPKSKQVSRDFVQRNGIVHRLDKETSGVLIVAKTQNAYSTIQDQFKKRKVGKQYLTLVHGKIELDRGEVNMPVGRLPWNREKFGVLPGGKNAITDYELIDYYTKKSKTKPNPQFSLLKIIPKTGRTHQIRVHMKHLRHPVVSDETYAGRKTSKTDRSWCPRLFLHAAKIEFMHPKSRKQVNYESPLSSDLKSSLKKLTKI